jgi:hypothetical protein
LSQPLDFTAINEGAASEPSEWAFPFTIEDGTKTEFIMLDEGHFVRVAAGCKPSDLAA